MLLQVTRPQRQRQERFHETFCSVLLSRKGGLHTYNPRHGVIFSVVTERHRVVACICSVQQGKNMLPSVDPARVARGLAA